jgi:hypothetical protein
VIDELWVEDLIGEREVMLVLAYLHEAGNDLLIFLWGPGYPP